MENNMSKNDKNNMKHQQLIDRFKNFHKLYYLKLHRCFNVNIVEPSWQIGKDNRSGKLPQNPAMRKIDDIHILYIKNGSGTYIMDGENVPMEKGDLFFVSNGIPHTAYSNPDDLVSIHSLRFGMYNICNDLYVKDFFEDPFYIKVSNRDSFFDKQLSKLYLQYMHKESYSDFATNALLTQILFELIERTKKKDLNKMELDGVCEFINDCHGKACSVKDLAKINGMSEKNFTRKFYRKFKILPNQYIIRTKINYAQYLLEETDLKNKEIAEVIGYSDPFIFSRQFKKTVGISPREYRINKKN